ncbi:MAG: preprotein translocase subunit SecA [Solitalea-like symbiont of Acarus siro]
MLELLTKIFGKKSDRDIKKLKNILNHTNTVYNDIRHISNDELREKTITFKSNLNSLLKPLNNDIEQLEALASETNDIYQKSDLYHKVEKLKEQSYEKTQEYLNSILPEAFAVIKETARRFKENDELHVKATDLDKNLATKKDNIIIKDDIAIYKNTWQVSGYNVKWDMTHYDVQLLGGMVLHQGKVAEMATGEGKTLVATSAAYLNALTGKGVHMVTVNNYLAKRDSEWMGPLYEFHGLTVDCIDNYNPHSKDRKQAYLADIVFGTNNEFGFDYLRDNMVNRQNELVQRELNYAIIDEVDSVLIDDARTPLIISGPTGKTNDVTENFEELKPYMEILIKAQNEYIVSAINNAQKLLSDNNSEEAGLLLLRCHRGMPKNKNLIKLLSEPGNKQLLQKTENFYMQDQQKNMHLVDKELFFVIDERQNNIDLTEKGIELLDSATQNTISFVLPDIGNQLAEIDNTTLNDIEKAQAKEDKINNFAKQSEKIHLMNQLLKAYTLFEKNVEYIVDNNNIKLIDEQTGRMLEGRRYSDGLHQAIEAKENVKIQESTQTFATITLQNYFRIYKKLSGMTGTAITEAGELWEIYKLDVVEIPTNKTLKRVDSQDLVYKTKREKYNAVIKHIIEYTQQNRPVLVGTTSVEVSELLSKMLTFNHIPHNVLNAKMHKKEAEIIAEAGNQGTVTIATNMAGRGTDIKLGQGVKEAGGLAIIGTERHESRRVDRQLRGRSGRQGDPGSSQFFVSLQDNLMRLFGSDRIASLMDRMGLKEGEVIQHSMITRSIERAQKKVEENNFGVRKRLLEYDNIMNLQRNIIYAKRKHALLGTQIDLEVDTMIYDTCRSIVETINTDKNLENIKLDILRFFSTEITFDKEIISTPKEKITEYLYSKVIDHYNDKMTFLQEKLFGIVKNIYEDSRNNITDAVIVFTSIDDTIPVEFNVQNAYQSKAKDIIILLQQAVILNNIDDYWREHLRKMDDLKQSVQNAVYEQKDPLLVYKFEAFQLFNELIDLLQKRIITLLFGIYIPDRQITDEAPLKRTNNEFKNLQTQHAEFNNGFYTNNEQITDNEPIVRQSEKVKRNDLCPCGSGKKYKNCHSNS